MIRAMTTSVPSLIEAGRAAVRAGDASTARRAFEAALEAEPSGDAIEGLARVAYLELDFTRAIETWERAYAAHRDPIYEFTTQLATLEPPPAEVQQLLGATQDEPAAMSAFVSVVAGTLSPVEFFDPTHIQRLLAGARASTVASPG